MREIVSVEFGPRETDSEQPIQTKVKILFHLKLFLPLCMYDDLLLRIIGK